MDRTALILIIATAFTLPTAGLAQQGTCPPGMACPGQSPRDSADQLRRRNMQIENERRETERLGTDAMRDQTRERQRLQDRIRPRQNILVPDTTVPQRDFRP